MKLSKTSLSFNLDTEGGTPVEMGTIRRTQLTWRREGDSNSRGALTPTRFRGVRFQPLTHLSLVMLTTSPKMLGLLIGS